MIGRTPGRPEPIPIVDDGIVISATPSPQGSPKVTKSALSVRPMPQDNSDIIEDSDEEADKSKWQKKRKLLYVDIPPPRDENGLLAHEKGNLGLLRSRQRVQAPMKPLVSKVDLAARMEQKEEVKTQGPEGYFRVMWRKYTTKKHKTWDDDGFLVLRNGVAQLIGSGGKEMGKTSCKDALLPGSQLGIGGKEVEVDDIMAKSEFMSGKCFLNGGAPKPPPTMPSTRAAPMALLAPKSFKRPASALGSPFKRPKMNGEQDDAGDDIAPTSFYGSKPQASLNQKFKTPVVGSTVVPKAQAGFVTPKHDPYAYDALVMKRPLDCPKGKQIVDVVVDPLLSKKLRPHQREGVKFLYECVMSLRDYGGQGALLADDMGLGKTFQTIALIWTLLKQNPIHKVGDIPSASVIQKVLIVCPVTLIENWQKEFRSWLGKERIGVLVADTKTRLTDFTHGRSYSVMIVGYERVRTIAEELDKGGGIDLVIADEGHRLKTEKNKSAQAIRGLRTERKIVLSGTPLQNDLTEFFVMVDFINPGLLGSANSFKKNFENPILKSRQPNASEKDKELGEARQAELSELTSQFILRRTADVQAKYLPPKTEIILFCQPTTVQAEIYQQILESPACASALSGAYKAAQALSLITTLRKVCNSPRLLLPTEVKAKAKAKSDDDDFGAAPDVMDYISQDKLRASMLSTSTKMRVLDALLKHLSDDTDEKVVIVSNFTATLNILGSHLAGLGLNFLRLDGDVPTNRRQDIVNEFNKSSPRKNFALLLSAKAGGVGLNLIGASRLVLFDVDWNPATDQQAMARVHRPGQTRPCFIYRFLLAGGMDEKIFQRQITKSGLADAIVDQKKTASAFTQEDLRDLFTLEVGTGCKTHVLMGCDCGGTSAPMFAPEPEVKEEKQSPVVIESSPPPPNSISEEDSDDDLPVNPSTRRRKPTGPIIPPGKAHLFAFLKTASANDWNPEMSAEAAKRAEANKGKMDALMKYEHVDCGVFGDKQDVFGFKHDHVKKAEARLGDSILTEVLGTKGVKVNWLFVNKSGLPTEGGEK